MKQINNFVDSVYNHVHGNKKEIQELKEEMKSHLIDSVYELQKQGKSETEAIDIAIKRFGGKNELQQALFQIFHKQKTFAQWLLRIGITTLILGVISFVLIVIYSNWTTRENSNISSEIAELLEKETILDNKTQSIIEETLSHSPHITELNIYDLKEIDSGYAEYWNVIERSTPTYHYEKTLSLPKWLLSEYGFAGNGDDTWCITYQYLIFDNLAWMILFISISIYGTLFTIWAIINAYHHHHLNKRWIIIFALFNVIGYAIYTLYYRQNNPRTI